jgi:CheY-like chemotaxis protein
MRAFRPWRLYAEDRLPLHTVAPDMLIKARLTIRIMKQKTIKTKKRNTSTTSSRSIQTSRKRRPLVLIVDDIPSMREFWRFLLETTFAVRVAEAETSEEALRLAKRRKIDLVISDIVRPEGTSGLVFLRMFKKTYPGVPVIIVSGQAAFVRRQAKGAFAVLAKDELAVDALSKAVAKALAQN